MYPFPPTYVLPWIPTPPFTVSAPVPVLVDGCVLPIYTLLCKTAGLATFKFPPMFIFPAIPTPPLTTREPVPIELDSIKLFPI